MLGVGGEKRRNFIVIYVLGVIVKTDILEM